MSRTKLIPGQNDLATINPTLAAEWHPTKNGALTPQSVSPGSNKRVWWLCEQGHEWEAAVTNRSNGTGCPQCKTHRLRRLVPGQNDLQTTNPSLAAQWHPTKNDDLLPSQVTVNSNLSVWWQCEKGHEWQARIFNRNRGTGCPFCSPNNVRRQNPIKNDLQPDNPTLTEDRPSTDPKTLLRPRILIRGHNDLQTANPDLAKEWHPTKNGALLPSQVTTGSRRKVWWQCEKGHEWAAVIDSRNNGAGCPICSGRTLLPGYNDLATVDPRLASEWHPTKNGDLLPQNLFPNTRIRVWWQCKEGHEWQATVFNRRTDSGCPICAAASKGLKPMQDPDAVK